MYNNHEKTNRQTNYGYSDHLALLKNKQKNAELFGVGDFEYKPRYKSEDTSGGHKLCCPKKY